MRRHAAALALLLSLLSLFPQLRADSTGESVTTRPETLPIPLYQTSAVYDGQYAYVFGGLSAATNDMNAIVRYDPVARSASAVATMQTPRDTTAAVWDPHANVAYVIGGNFAGRTLNNILRYDPATGTAVDELTGLPCARWAPSAVFDGTYAYVFGGFDTKIEPNCPPDSIFRYDPTNSKVQIMNAHLTTDNGQIGWTSAIWDPRTTTACPHGCAYVFGGQDIQKAEANGFGDTILRYDPASDTVTTMHSHFQSVRIDTVAAFDGTRAYILGGIAGDDSSLNEIVWFDPLSDTIGKSAMVLPKYTDEASGVWAESSAYLFGGFACDNPNSQCSVSQAIVQYQPPSTATTVQPPANVPPSASFAATTTDLTVDVDASASTDTDGTVTSYAWAWGDGTTGSGTPASHTYASAGTYTIQLTVTDNDRATGTTTQSVTVTPPPSPPTPSSAPPPPNQPPTASFSATTDNLTAKTDASSSSDPDGTITTYLWSWGDGATSTGSTSKHTYATSGNYTIRLAVTDNATATATTMHNVTVATSPAPPEPSTLTNPPPTANFTAITDNLTVTVNASASNDTDGMITSYTWMWGDNTSMSSGATISHTYAASGNYTVRLTVTDNANATANTTRAVHVQTAPPTPTNSTTDVMSSPAEPTDPAPSATNEGTNSTPTADTPANGDQTTAPSTSDSGGDSADGIPMDNTTAIPRPVVDGADRVTSIDAAHRATGETQGQNVTSAGTITGRGPQPAMRHDVPAWSILSAIAILGIVAFAHPRGRF